MTSKRYFRLFNIEKDTFIPIQDLVLYNFDESTEIILIPNFEYCICYKQGEIGFNIYRKKFNHTFMAELSSTPMNNSFVRSMNHFN